MFGVESLRNVLCVDCTKLLVPPHVAARSPIHIITGSLNNQDMLNTLALATRERLVDCWLEWRGLTLAETSISCDD